MENDRPPVDKTVTFLVVEDDEVDVKGIMRAFKRMKIANPIVRAEDGLEALDYLRGTNGKQQIPSPYLILLDLNMPRMGGLEFLDAIRQDEDLDTSIVFVLTTSKDDEDRIAAYKKHIAGYVVKTDVQSSFDQAINMLDCYWRVVEFP